MFKPDADFYVESLNKRFLTSHKNQLMIIRRVNIGGMKIDTNVQTTFYAHPTCNFYTGYSN